MDFLSFLEKCLAAKWRKLRADLLHGCMLEVSYTNWRWHFACFVRYGNENSLVCWFLCDPFNSHKEHLSFLFSQTSSADTSENPKVFEGDCLCNINLQIHIAELKWIFSVTQNLPASNVTSELLSIKCWLKGLEAKFHFDIWIFFILALPGTRYAVRCHILSS